MTKLLYSLLFISLTISLSAQKFSAPGQGFFKDGSTAILTTIDSSDVELIVDGSAYNIDEIPEKFYFLDKDGEQVSYEPEEILRLVIMRGDVPEDFAVIEPEIDDEDFTGKFNYAYSDTEKMIFERVAIDTEEGVEEEGGPGGDSYLLQLASEGMGDRMRIYNAPAWNEEGNEVAPLGSVVTLPNRNRVDYDVVQSHYYVKIAEKPAFLISEEEFLYYTPVMFQDNRPFRRKYSVPKMMDDERTKRRKKTARKDVNNKKKKDPLTRYAELSRLVKDYHVLYAEQERLNAEKKKN